MRVVTSERKKKGGGDAIYDFHETVENLDGTEAGLTFLKARLGCKGRRR